MCARERETSRGLLVGKLGCIERGSDTERRERKRGIERERNTDSAVEHRNVGEWQCLSGRRSFESRTHGFSLSFSLSFSLFLSLSFFYSFLSTCPSIYPPICPSLPRSTFYPLSIPFCIHTCAYPLSPSWLTLPSPFFLRNSVHPSSRSQLVCLALSDFPWRLHSALPRAVSPGRNFASQDDVEARDRLSPTVRNAASEPIGATLPATVTAQWANTGHG